MCLGWGDEMIVSKNINDCYTCALATLLERKYEEVPYHNQYCENPTDEQVDSFYKERDEWLLENGYIAICMPWDMTKPFPIFSGDSIRCIADCKTEGDTHAIVVEARRNNDVIDLEIIYDNHMHNSYVEIKDVINLEFIFKA